jgi:hypothetical protein
LGLLSHGVGTTTVCESALSSRWIDPASSTRLSGCNNRATRFKRLAYFIRLRIDSSSHCSTRLSFSQLLDSLESSSSWTIQEFALPSDLQPTIDSLKSGSARSISDGSFKDKFGTSAFTILDDRACSILGLNVVPGHPDDQGAYRSELAGLFGIMLVVTHLCLWARIESGGIKIECNGLSALNKAYDTWPLEPTGPHFDMLSSLRKKIATSPITWTTHHIEGHQDNNATAKLDFWAKQNIQMDNLAKVFWMRHSHSSPMFYPISDEGFQVWLGDRKLSSHSASGYFDHIHGQTILN